MEPKFQTSFIPKSPVVSAPNAPKMVSAHGPREMGGIWSFIANTLFTIAVVASFIIFGVEWYLNRTIASMDTSLAAAREEIEPERIAELTRAHERITSVKSLLSEHVALSAFFEKLQTLTVKSLRFSNFSFTTLGSKGIEVLLKGEAIGYVSVAQQAEVFNKETTFKDPNFFDLDLDRQGAVIFSFKTVLLPEAISYSSKIIPSQQ